MRRRASSRSRSRSALTRPPTTACISNTATVQQVNQEHQQGIGAGVTGTPTIFINSRKQTAYDLASLSASIDKAYGNATPAPLPSGAATPSSSPGGQPSS